MTCFGLKKIQDLGNRAAHPLQELRGVHPPPPRSPELFKIPCRLPL